VTKSVDFTSKRKFPRRGYRKPVGLLYRGKFWLGLGEEIGEGGLGVISNEPVNVEDQVVVTLVVPGGEMAVVRSIVRYCAKRGENQFEFGLQFVNFNFRFKKTIRDYIAAKSEAEARGENGLF